MVWAEEFRGLARQSGSAGRQHGQRTKEHHEPRPFCFSGLDAAAEAGEAADAERCGRPALAEGFVEHDGARGGNIERADASGHGDAEEVVAGAAYKIVEAGAFAAQHEDAVAGEVELVVVGGAAFVEADDPEILLLQVFKGTNQVDDARDAEVFCGAGAGFDGDRAEGRGTAFGENHAIDPGAVGDAEQSAQILGILDAIECQQQAGSGGSGRGVEEVFDGEKFLRADHGHDALVGGGAGQLRELLAGFLADADAGFAARGNEAEEAGSWRSRATITWSKRRRPARTASSTACSP